MQPACTGRAPGPPGAPVWSEPEHRTVWERSIHSVASPETQNQLQQGPQETAQTLRGLLGA